MSLTKGNTPTSYSNKTPTRKCKGCSNNIATDHVKCPKCAALYHPSCAKNTVQIPNGGFQRCCGPKKAVSLDDIRDILKEENAPLRNDITNLCKSIDLNTEAINKRLSTVEKVTQEISNRVVALEESTELNHNTIKSIAEKINNDSNAIFKEVEDRLSRQKNAIFFGVQESKDESSKIRQEHDKKVICEICAELAPDVTVVGSMRIGKFSASLTIPRPLKVFLVDMNHVGTLINALQKINRQTMKKLLKGISISKDRTILQRAEYKKVREDLERRKALGELNLRIVTRNGAPTIVNYRQANHQTTNTSQYSTP